MAKTKPNLDRFVVQDGEVTVLGRALTDAEHKAARAKLARGVPLDEVAAEYADKIIAEEGEGAAAAEV